MSGNNSDDGDDSKSDSSDKFSDDRSDFSEGEDTFYDSKTKQYVPVKKYAMVNNQANVLSKPAHPILFNKDAYKTATLLSTVAEQEIHAAIKDKVDDILVLLQQHASKTSNISSRQASTSSAVGKPEPSLQDVAAEINALIGNLRRQYINSARREGGGMTASDLSMIKLLWDLQKNLGETSYAEVLKNFLEKEMQDNYILIAKGDSTDPLLHYIYEHPETKQIIKENAYKQYRDAVDEHFISNTESSLGALKVAEAGISNILSNLSGPKITAISIALAKAAENRVIPKLTPHHKLD